MSATTHSYPLSLCQQRLWLLDQLRPGNSIYNLSAAVPVPPDLDLVRLQQSCNLLVTRHESLRTTFDVDATEPVQIVHPAMHVPLETVDLRGATTAAAQAALLAAAQQPFSLRSGPLLRTVLLRISPQLQLYLVSMHHIISDARSMEIFLSELGHCYEALGGRAPLRLPNLSIQYSDYSVWQRDYLRGPRLHADTEFWCRTLAGLPLLQLPTDFPRKLEPSFGGNEVPMELDPAAVLQLAAFAQRQGATLFMVFLTVFCVLLARYSSQDDIVVGTPVSGRNYLQLEDLIGFFVNSLILRCDLAGDPSFATLLGRIRATALAAYAHQELPFEKLVEKLKPPRDLARNPLFQVLFQMQHGTVTPARGPADPSSGPPLLRAHSSPFDIALNLRERSGHVSGTLQYATELFRRETAANMAKHFRNLVVSAATNPNEPISKLALLDAAERRSLLRDWNRSNVAPLSAPLIHHCVRKHAHKTPDAIAVVSSEGTISYAELDSLANSLASTLVSRGVKQGTRVGLRMRRSPDVVVAVVAIWKAGGVYVPIDPDYPVERARFMLQDSGIRLLLVSDDTRGVLTADVACEVAIDLADIALNAVDEVPVDDEGDPAPAYIIYTSGSTGRPKGVILNHGGLRNIVQSQLDLLPVSSSSCVLQFSSLSFDASVFELALTFGSGATLCIPNRDTLMPDTQEFSRFLTEMAVDTIVMPPALLAAADPGAYPTLRVILFAGDVCSRELAEAWLPGRQVFNLYGPTEATIWATSAELARDGGVPPIGRPIPRTRAYVLDRRRCPVPIGVQGELYLAGAGVAGGYLNQPELSAECFFANPFDNAEEYRVLYRTGDVCRYRSDGHLEYLGRADRVVKVRGCRIELCEVETVLRSHPAVRECCAVVRAGGSADACVIAYIVARSEPNEEDLQSLRSFVRRHLPAFMVPTSILFIDSMPLSINGKIDRPQLTRGDIQVKRFQHTGGGEPENAIESVISAVWREVLQVDRAGAEDSFFDLGGHSMLAIRARTLLESRLGKPVKVTDLFQFPTPASLATHLFPIGRM